MQGKNLVIGLLGALVAALGFVFWLGATGGGRASDSGLAQSSVGRAPPEPRPTSTATTAAPDSGADHDGGTVSATVTDTPNGGKGR